MGSEKEEVKWPLSTTHMNSWLLRSVSEFREIQERTLNSALERIKAKGIDSDLPTLEDELWLVRFYAFQLSRFLVANHMKDAVKETALTFFNRFYLMRSMLEHDPRLIMFTCITLAIKLEDVWRNYYVDKLLGAVEGLNVSKVFELEATVCDALNFNFLVLHTHDSMHILRMKCMEVCSKFLNILSMFQFLKECLGIDDEILGEHLGLILSVCNDAEKDAVQMHERPEFIFLYTPTQLAVANFVRYSKRKLGTLISVDKFLTNKLLYGNESQLEPLNKVIKDINDSYEEYLTERSTVDSHEQRAGAILDKYLPLYDVN
ncbi:hypothetical protein X943_002599 [Babesia divergens]|uniref:Cyclin N-terminal domain-containing protein n=1 Tax=Babesia divergens TaxID=32595 RepID=A0AAD9G7E9_BABDI|nr:hypothetical protein X943_002599 [Babesia divergens]